jgi:hypothetical protein
MDVLPVGVAAERRQPKVLFKKAVARLAIELVQESSGQPLAYKLLYLRRHKRFLCVYPASMKVID